MPFFFYFRSCGLSAPLPFFAVGTFSSTVTKLSQDVYGPKETPTYVGRQVGRFPPPYGRLVRCLSSSQLILQALSPASAVSVSHPHLAGVSSLRSTQACRRRPLSHGCVSATMMVGQHHHQPATHRRTGSPTSLPSHSWRQLSAHGRPQHPRGAFWKVCPRSGRPSDASLTSRTPTSSA